jgi:hypothetical protein
VQDRLAAADPDTLGYRRDAGVTRYDLAKVLFDSQRPEEADQVSRRPLTASRRWWRPPAGPARPAPGATNQVNNFGLGDVLTFE